EVERCEQGRALGGGTECREQPDPREVAGGLSQLAVPTARRPEGRVAAAKVRQQHAQPDDSEENPCQREPVKRTGARGEPAVGPVVELSASCQERGGGDPATSQRVLASLWCRQ